MKRFLLFNVSVIAFLMMFALPLNAAQTDGGDISPASILPLTYSGGCGDDGDTSTSSNVTWFLNTTTGVLTVSGSGEMKDYPYFHLVPYFFLRDYIQSIVIESGVTGIGNCAFNCCGNLTSVTIADSVTSIGDCAFIYCEKLTEFTIPDNITSIGDYAFSGCWGITTLTIGEGVTSIGKGAFEKLKKLTAIQWNAKKVADFAQQDEVFSFAGFGDEGITVTFGSKVTAIPAYAFFVPSCNSANIIAVNLNDSVVTIGDYAFARLKHLTSITIPFATKAIGSGAFYKCNNAFLIYGYTFSYAEAYANDNHIPFSSLGYQYFDILYYDGEDTLTLTPAQYGYGVGEASLPTPEKTGHSFDGWYDNEDLTGDAVTAIDTTQTGTVSLYAKWMVLHYDITVDAGSHGSISPASATIDYGEDQSFSITPDEGYDIEDVLVDGTSVGAVTSYTFEDVTAAHSIAATFVKQTFNISVDAGSNGSISPASATVEYGEDQAFTVTPDEGYKIEDVLVDGTSVGAVSSYTFEDVTAAHSIAATFVKQTFNISVDAGNNGSISPACATVDYGEDQSFSITPDTGYKIEDVLVDGTSVGAVSSYTFEDVTAAHSISATFVKQTFAISVDAGSNGSISPASATVDYGEDQSFSITPDTGYKIEDVLVDGTSVGAVSSYTFEDVTAAHSISATFKKVVSITFVDVPKGSWFADYVYDLVRKGILCGYANDHGTCEFRPYQNITRAEFAAILARVSGEDLSGYKNKTSFQDVPATFWGAKEIEWAYQNGVVKGVGDNKYAPNSYITRQEMAAMIYRFATVYKGETLPQTDAALTFSDNGDIAPWAAEAVTAMQLSNIIDGIANDDGTFRFAPKSNATRAQAAKMISVYLSL